MNEQPQQAVPYKTDQEKPKTNYEAQPNGDVKIVQEVKTTSYWKAREFLSLLRQNEEALVQTKRNYSEEFVESMKKQEAELVEEIKLMAPVMEQAEKLATAEYEKQRHEGLKSSLLTAIEAKEFNAQWWINVWNRTKPEVKDPIFKELNREQQKKVLKCIARLKRKGVQ